MRFFLSGDISLRKPHLKPVVDREDKWEESHPPPLPVL